MFRVRRPMSRTCSRFSTWLIAMRLDAPRGSLSLTMLRGKLSVGPPYHKWHESPKRSVASTRESADLTSSCDDAHIKPHYE